MPTSRRRAAPLILQSRSVPPPSVVSEWDKKYERRGRGTYAAKWVYFSHVCQHGGRDRRRRRRHFAEVVVIRDGPLFIRPLFPLALSQRGFHPSPTEREGEGERGRTAKK